MAKTPVSKTFYLSTAWNGRKYSQSSDVPAVNAPSGLSASASTTTINLSWTNGEPTASTVIERSNNGSGGWITIATKAAGVTSHADTSLAVGTYYYRVSHLINSVSSSVSSTANASVASGGGSVADGDTVTVTIPGAGSNVSVSQFQFLGGSYGPIESASVGAVFNTFMPSGWAMPGSTGTRVSTAQTLNGTKSLQHDRTLGATFGFNYDTGGIRRSAFAICTYRFTNPNAISGGQLKMMRFSGTTSNSLSIQDTGYANCYLTHYSSNYMPRNDSGGSLATLYTGTDGPIYQEGEWISIHFRATDSSAVNVADGSVQVTTIRESDGSILGTWTQTGLVMRNASDALIRKIVFQWYMGNNYNATSGVELYLDRDIACAYSDTTTPPKYIMLGDASTWAACTKRTYCEWVTWTNNGATSDIAIKVNKGQHANLTGKYVYAMSDAGTVINSTGVAL